MNISLATDSGALGVFQLKRIWSSHIASLEGRTIPPSRRTEWRLDHVVLCGLNLALEETLQHLARVAPTFDAFEHWVLARNDGVLDPRQVARINAAVIGDLPTKPLPIPAGLECAVPVLSAGDHAHWSEHGYVIVRGAISRDQAAAAADLLWQFRGMDPDDPDTWYPHRTHGIMVQLIHHPILRANRESARVRRAFEEIWGMDDLWVTTDRVSFNPPERAGWRFPGPRLHWDADFETRPVPFATQGLIYLTDTPAHQGAFACMPGFHRRIDAWLDSLSPGADPANQDLGAFKPTPIAAEAGDLIIWHHALPHGATPNSGTRPRIVQYVTMLPTPGSTIGHGTAGGLPSRAHQGDALSPAEAAQRRL